jgi:phosphatidylglycerol lysyltransferase
MADCPIQHGCYLVYGIIGFYVLDRKHFNAEFSLIGSVKQTLASYFLIGSNKLVPLDTFGRDFIYSLNTGGFLTLSFLLYTLIRPYVYKGNASAEDLAKAADLISKFSNQALIIFRYIPQDDFL